MKTAVVWYPGADVAVNDVAAGLQAGLEAQGVNVCPFRLSAHLEAAGAALAHRHAVTQKERGGDVPAPTLQDVYYLANMGVLERALRHDAEVVFMVSGLYQHPDYAVMLQRSGRRVVLLCTESPYSVEQEMRMLAHKDPVSGRRCYDHVFVNERTMVARYAAHHPSVSYLGAAYNADVHKLDAESGEAPAHDVVFVGTGFIERQRLLEKIDWAGVDFGLYGTWGMVKDASPLAKLLPDEREGFLLNRLAVALYRKAKAGLNLHRTSVEYTEETAHVRGAQSANPRCYELAATGLFFITDWRKELDEVFGRGTLPTFKTPAQAQALIRRALAEPAWRADVAGRAAERVKGHSWAHRAATALTDLRRAGVAAA